MNPKLAGTIMVGVLAAATIVAVIAKSDTKTQTLSWALDAGMVTPTSVYAEGASWKSVLANPDGGADIVTYLDHSPCRARPKGVAVTLCSRVCLTGKEEPHGQPEKGPCDPGMGNVMSWGQWVDNGGCVEVACVEMLK